MIAPLPAFPAMESPGADRQAALTAFLAATGWADARRVPLAADASFRRYDRLIRRDGARAVLMDAPPPQEDTRPFIRLSRHLAALGLSVPVVLEADPAAGFLLLDDLGDDTFTRVLDRNEDPEALYRLAIDGLVHLHDLPIEQTVPSDLPVYDTTVFLNEALVFIDWYLPACGRPASPQARESFCALWRDLLPLANAAGRTLVLRDVHVDNLMLLKDRPGIGRCGFLDFQDALAGPITYDLMSLLEDRRDLPDIACTRLRQAYLTGRRLPIDAEAFETSWAIVSAHRHIKVLGVFTRLDRRDGKSAYLAHLPRLWRLIDRRLTHPVLAPLAAWLAMHGPSPEQRLPDTRHASDVGFGLRSSG